MAKSLEERSELRNDLHHHEESSYLVIGLGILLYKSVSTIKGGIEQLRHLGYHIAGVEHRRVENDPDKSFPYYERVFSKHE